MIRFCPKCETERESYEQYCENVIDGETCGWNLAPVPFSSRGQGRPAPSPPPPMPPAGAAQCVNGHQVVAGDLLCPTCGALLGTAAPGQEQDSLQPSFVDGWELGRRLPSTSRVRERFVAVRGEDGRTAVLTLYSEGSEPDSAVYDLLRTLSRDHVPEIIATGRWHDRAYEVMEELTGGTLAELGALTDDAGSLRSILSEVGRALHSFAEAGLRHRDLRPGAILVRSRDPLDLVITSFGSARLSDFDLDLVSPLETTRYTAPEAALGGVAAASDWWSLGMILLEQVTGGACFEGVNEQAFLIHVLTNGAPIPDDLDPRFHLLLCGLLARERRERWGWAEVTRWLNGETLSPPPSARGVSQQAGTGPSIRLGDHEYATPAAFALAAADSAVWPEARDLLTRGALATWAEEAGLDSRVQAGIRQVAQLHELSEDFRLGIALKILTPAIPLACRGEIVTPGWLLDHPTEGYDLITGPAPDLLARMEAELWLSQLKARAASVRERARHLEVDLNEEDLRIHLLSTSRSRLAALWDERRHILPDTDHPALLAILERRQISEEDLILLLSADPALFRAAEEIISQARTEASQGGFGFFDYDRTAEQLRHPRREIYQAIDQRSAGFARCGLARIDEWVDRFRLERRLPLSRALLVLAVPESSWRAPAKQTYVSTLLDFFARRVVVAVQRGPLTRMTIGKTTARVDLAELGTDRVSAETILTQLLLRSDQTIGIDPAAFQRAETAERRIRALYAHANLYRRDTGIDGLYLGFPFLVNREGRGTTLPRIAPVLLWPVRLRPEVGAQGRVSVGFDRDREEVRVNPAFDTLLGPEGMRRWREAADQVLGRGTLSIGAVIDGFGALAAAQGRTLVPLPSRDARARAGEDQLSCSAVLFHLAYTGQAVAEDLRHLKGIPPAGTALETALRVSEPLVPEPVPTVPELDRFFTAASDPSQEAAVFEARRPPGLVVEGPPGTGKSQTIVNMISDAIGRKQSLLIVCQKQAALDVVHKRLEAEGLGHRVGMITDVNKDREPVVRAIREQLEGISATPPAGGAWRHRREAAAARIESLEADLDRHHALLHQIDEATGLTYRELLGELIRVEHAHPPPVDVPGLRPLTRLLGAAEVARLEEVCGPLAAHWLPADFEDSPLSDLTVLAPDPVTLSDFRKRFDTFVRVEGERADVVGRTPNAARITDPASLGAWLRAHTDGLRRLQPDERARLARWLPLLRSATAGRRAAEFAAELAAIEAGLHDTRGPDAAAKTRHVVIGIGDDALRQWHALAEEIAAPAGLLAALSPQRWTKRWRLNATFKAHGLADVAHDLQGFIATAANEIRRRPWRRRLAAAWAELDPDAAVLDRWSTSRLLELVRTLADQLAAAQGLADRLHTCPEPSLILPAIRSATGEAFESAVLRAEQGLARAAARTASRSVLAELEPWFNPEWRSARAQAVDDDRPGGSTLALILQALPTLEPYQRFRLRAGHLDPLALEVFRALRRAAPVLRAVKSGELDEVVRRTIGREARLAWKARREQAEPLLLTEASELAAKSAALAAADAEMRRTNRELLIHGIDRGRLRPAREWEEITRLRGQRARRLREFIGLGADLGLLELRPVWLMNPDVASRVLPLKAGLFDTVIYDEASQIPVEYALPSLFRSRAMIVSGDEKQMPPTAFFSSRVENDEADIFEPDEMEEGLSDDARAEVSETWNRREIKDCPDLLQLARSVLSTTTLQIHYRSAYRELIAFSNASFYVNQLSIPVRHPDDEVRRVRPVELVQVNGTYQDQTNAKEAAAVVDCLASLWSITAEERKTVGVVTFNRKQADLIETVLESRAEQDDFFRHALTRERERVQGGEDMSFFVKNVENVQGDERDVIIFSSTFGRNSQGTFRRNFGVLGQAGGERRLNVAITRARKKVILITSMPIGEISDLLATRRLPASPRDYLQAYFEYTRALSTGDLEGGRSLLARLVTDRKHEMRSQETEMDGFQAAVAEFIQVLGCKPAHVQESGAFGIDFAIEDPRTGLYGIGIECDAPRHRLLSSARAREMWRPAMLRRSIRHVHRVSSRSWYHDRSSEQERLRSAIETALS